MLENFCDSNREVAFQKNTCIIRNLDGVDLHSGSRDTNLYIISLDDMLNTSPIYLLSKASKTKSWLWHPRLSHLNFGTLNKLAKYGLARGIPKLKSKKDHLCLACSLAKSKKSSHQPKAEVTNQKKLYLLHMDLCGPIHVESIKNVAANHLSRIDYNESSDDSEVDDNFPGETLMEINTGDEPWFADFSNYLIPKGMAYQQKNKFFSDLKHYFWEEPYLFKAEAQALPTNDARVVITFLKKLFCHFRMPKALISDRDTHFYNKIMDKTMKRYGVSHRFSASYHPQTIGQVKNTNRVLKRILEKTVKDNPAIWSRKLYDALWAFCTAYKTPTDTTPYKLIYGKNCYLPFKIEHRAYWVLKNCNPDLIAAREKRMF
ncbi:reverse transcriptase domain-containing protein [Tanacetum coccineum]